MRRALPLAASARARRRPPAARADERSSTCPPSSSCPPNVTCWRATRDLDEQRRLRPRRRADRRRLRLGPLGPGAALLARRRPARPLRLPLHDPPPHGRHGRRLRVQLLAAATARSRRARRRSCTASRPPARRGADRGAPTGGGWTPVTPSPRRRRLASARVRPAAPTVYRAVTDAGPSLPLPLKVGARLDTTCKRLKQRALRDPRDRPPAQAGALAALQLYSRDASAGARSRMRASGAGAFVHGPPAGRLRGADRGPARQRRLRRERRPDRHIGGAGGRAPGARSRAAARTTTTCG